MKLFKVILLAAVPLLLHAQTFRADNVIGSVKVQKGTSENWTAVSPGDELTANSLIETGKNSSVTLSFEGNKLLLKESSALPLSRIKKMSLDDLILALAMEDMINAPKKKEEGKSKSTAVYGSEINGAKAPIVRSDDFGVKKLNGAVQLAEAGFKQSAVIDAKETYRKYPGVKSIPAFRIYFADILAGFGLNEEAYEEFNSIKNLKLDKDQEEAVGRKLKTLSAKLMRKE